LGAKFDTSHLGWAFLQASRPDADFGVMLLSVLMPLCRLCRWPTG
jgi:hypothetical protein